LKSYIGIGLIFLLFGCHQPNNKNVAVKAISPDHPAKVSKRDSLRIKIDEEVKIDSMRQSMALTHILSYASKHRKEASFKKKLALYRDTSLHTKLTFGHLFSRDKKHLIVMNESNYSDVNVNVFLLDGDKFHLIMNWNEWKGTYLGFEMRDVNGDHFKDLLCNWYGSSGCCARNTYNVHI
jgi:hypothetical protein